MRFFSPLKINNRFVVEGFNSIVALKDEVGKCSDFSL